MKFFLCLTVFFVLCLPPVLHAQVPVQVKASQVSDIDFYLTNDGRFGHNAAANQPGFIYPRGSGLPYLFGSGLWFGARKHVMVNGKDSLMKLSVMGYNMNTGVSWFTPIGYSSVIDSMRSVPPMLYYSRDYNQATGESVVPNVPPAQNPHWPLWLLPPASSTATMTNNGTYVPAQEARESYRQLGYKPAFINGVAEQFLGAYSDTVLSKYEIPPAQATAMGLPLGLQVEQCVYAPVKAPYMVLVQYRIINISKDTLWDCALAQVADPDIGSANNDHAGFHVNWPQARTATAWTEPESSGKTYKYLGMSLIEAPLVRGDGFVDNSKDVRQVYRLVGRVGTFRSWGIAQDPNTPALRYDFMTSGKIDEDVTVGDKRMLMASSKFSMRPGDTANLAVMYCIASSNQKADTIAVNAALEYALSSRGFMASTPDQLQEHSVPALAVLPNPAQTGSVVHFSLSRRADVRIQVVNPAGQVVQTLHPGLLEQGTYSRPIGFEGLAGGTYLVVLRAGDQVRVAGLTVTP